MKKKYFYTIALCFMLLGCNRDNTDYSKLYGFWGNEINDTTGSQKFVLYFYGKDKTIKCQFHSYFNGMKFSSEIGSDIEFDGESLSFLANKNANVLYDGKIDTVNQVITGKLKYADGSGREFNLNKISDEKLIANYPGLYNLTRDENNIEQPKLFQDGWVIGTTTESEMDSILLQTMVDSINSGAFGKVHSVLIAKNGKLIFEKYFDGFYINDLNSLQSSTKSIGSLLIGLAIDNGFIQSLDQKVLGFFPNYKNNVNEKWLDVDLKHLLTMSLGLDWGKNLQDQVYRTSNDVIKTTFELKFSNKPGQLFEYRSPQTDLLSGIIINTSEKSVQDFAKEYLFDPLQITSFSWPNFKNNNYPLMSGSLALRSRDMLKIGQLALDKGKWNDKQIVSKNWIEESTSYKIKTDQTLDYGYLWWLGESRVKPGLKGIIAIGIGGQHIVIVPEINVVAVTTANNMDRDPDFLLNMIDDYIIKSVK